METNRDLRAQLKAINEEFSNRIDIVTTENSRLYKANAKLRDQLKDTEWLIEYSTILIRLADIPDTQWKEADSQLLHRIRMEIIKYKKQVSNA